MSPIKFYVKCFRQLTRLSGYFIVLFLFTQHCAGMNIPVHAVAKKGVLDLRSAPITDKIELNGEWVFYWRQLLNPGDKPAGKPTLTDFPSLYF